MTPKLRLLTLTAALIALQGVASAAPPLWPPLTPGDTAGPATNPHAMIFQIDGDEDDDDDEGGWIWRSDDEDDDDDDDEECEDDDDDDDDCGSGVSPAPSGTTAPPANKLFVPGTAPKAKIN